MNVSHILIPSDLSAEALRPCLPVAELARALGARITLLHVTEDVPIAAFSAPTDPIVMPVEMPDRTDSAREALDKHRDLFPGIDVRVDVVTGLDASYEILEYARRNDADLIAMSTHGRTGFRRLVLGSVAEAVLRRSPVPVVVFPREDVEEKRLEKTA